MSRYDIQIPLSCHEPMKCEDLDDIWRKNLCRIYHIGRRESFYEHDQCVFVDIVGDCLHIDIHHRYNDIHRDVRAFFGVSHYAPM